MNYSTCKFTIFLVKRISYTFEKNVSLCKIN